MVLVLRSLIGSDAAFLRSLVQNVRRAISEKEDTAVEIDLSDIKFISRAFAHELACLAEETKAKGLTLSYKNASADVLALLGKASSNSQEQEAISRPDLHPSRRSFKEMEDQL